MSAGRFHVSLSEYPPADYRRLVEAAAERYGVGTDELVVGAGADEILDVIGKTFLAEGSRGDHPDPDLRDVPGLTEQRGARAVPVPRLGAGEGYALDLPAIRDGRPRGRRSLWLCRPNNPTAQAEPDGAIADAPRPDRGRRRRPTADPRPIVVVDEAYAEFAGRSLADLRFDHPNLIVDPDRQQGLRARRAPRRVRDRPARARRADEPDPSAGFRVDRVGDRRDRGAAATRRWRRRTSARRRRARSRSSPSCARPAGRSDRRRHELRPGRPRLGRSRRCGRRGACCSAASSRARSPTAHPLADHLRFTVRSREQNDRLIAAARRAQRRAPRRGLASPHAGRSRAGACRSATSSHSPAIGSGTNAGSVDPLAVDRHATAGDQPARLAARRERRPASARSDRHAARHAVAVRT